MFVIHDFLTLEECAEYVRVTEVVGYGPAPISTAGGFVMAPEIRNNERVILIRDSDNDLERRDGLHQARSAEPWPFPVVIRLAHTKRECWHIAGFEPKDEEERERFESERQFLGFDPRTHSHELTAKHDEKNDKRSAKRVLIALTADDLTREAECLTALAVLHERGEENGLRAFLKEIDTLLVPLFTR